MAKIHPDIHYYRSIIDDELKFKRKFHVSPKFANCLFLKNELKQHMGCVNCLEWNINGSLLMSGSDDRQIIIWSVEDSLPKLKISTFHEGNIFAVKYLTNDETVIASASADAYVQLYKLTECSSQHLYTYTCHKKSVNTLEKFSSDSNVFFSGSEDGFVRRFDIRESHIDCSDLSFCNTEFIKFNDIGIYSMKMNPTKPNMLALGCTDTMVRIYDIRNPNTCLSCLLPLHSIKWDQKFDYFNPSMTSNLYDYYVTSISFTSDGTQLLSNINGDSIYLFDLINTSNPISFNIPQNVQIPDIYSKIKVYERYKNMINLNREISDHSSKQYKSQINGKELELLFQKIVNNSHNNDQLNFMDFNSVEKFLNVLKKSFQNGFYFDLLDNQDFLDFIHKLIRRNWNGDCYFMLQIIFCALFYCESHKIINEKRIKTFLRVMVDCLFFDRRYREAFQTIEDYRTIINEELTPELLMIYNECRSNMNSSNFQYHSLETNASEPKLIDFNRRYIGACNNATIIKQANFFGDSESLVIAGSDCGRFMIWNKDTSEVLASYMADSSVVNCVLPRQFNSQLYSDYILASSGIDNNIRIWSLQDDPGNNPETCDDLTMSYANGSDYSAVCIGKKVRSDQLTLLVNENMKLHTNTRNRRFYLLALYSQLESFSNEMFNSNNTE